MYIPDDCGGNYEGEDAISAPSLLSILLASVTSNPFNQQQQQQVNPFSQQLGGAGLLQPNPLQQLLQPAAQPDPGLGLLSSLAAIARQLTNTLSLTAFICCSSILCEQVRNQNEEMFIKNLNDWTF